VYGYIEVAMKAIIVDLSDDALQKVHNLPEVVYIEEEGVAYAASSESSAGDLWYLDRIGEVPAEGEGVDVYILDTGIMFQHKEFGNRAKYAGYDPVDQHEYDQETANYVPMHGADCHGHGTAVASLVGGVIHGKAKKANLYSVRVLRCDTTAPWTVVLDGLDFLAEIIPKRGDNAVVLLALSGSNSTAINHTIQSLYDMNVVVITAAGNHGTDACTKSPADSQFAITVGSTDRYDCIASTSNYGSCVDLFAPGVGIPVASSECDSCTDIMSGTTLSAALTAGVVAAHLSQTPNLTPSLIKERLSYQSIPGVINFTSIPEHARAETPNRLLNRGIVSVSGQQGVLQSPNFPNNYPTNMNIIWTLMAENHSNIIQINFTHIIMEEDYDTLTVCLKDVCSEEEMLVLTGDYYTPDCELYSEGGRVTLHMMTDSFTEAPGFRATFTALPSSKETKQNSCTSLPSSVNSSIQLDVFSAGVGVGERFSVKNGWDEISGGRKPGINLVVINEANGSVIATENFATYQSVGYSNQLAVFVDKIPLGRIVCAAVSANGASYLNKYGIRALMMLGADETSLLTSSASWALIGVKGAGCGQAIETLMSSATSPAQITDRVHLKPFNQPTIEITAESFGITKGYANITVQNTIVNIPYVGYSRGLNVVVVNEKTGTILHSQVFDTSVEAGAYSASSQFVELIDSLPEGRIVAIAIQEEGVDHLSEQAKQACESIGSAFIRQVHHGGAWAIVGRKGAAIGTVPESASNSKPVKSMFALTLSTENDIMCQINVHTTKHTGVGNNITVNGVVTSHSNPTTPGSLIALLRDGECSVEWSRTFAPSDLHEIIKPIPPGRTVVVNLAYNYRTLSESGEAALESIGSAKINSLAFPYTFAIIGRKGAPKGFVPEQAYNEENKALGASVPVRPVNDVCVFLESSTSLAKIEVNGVNFSLPSEYDQGLLAVVLDETYKNKYHIQVLNVNSSHDRELFVNLTHSMPNGTIIALVTNNAGPLNQSEDIKEAIEGFGSRYINEAVDNTHWVFIGQKGGSHRYALEAASNDGPTEIMTQTLPKTQFQDSTSCTIFVESAGTGSMGGLQFTINGQNINSSLLSGQGIRLAVMKGNSCELDYIHTYPTYTSYSVLYDLATEVGTIPAGRIVIASVYGAAFPYSYYSYYYHHRPYYVIRAITAFESIGSSLFHSVRYRDAWAIIGRKGAAMGSVPEAFIHGTPSSAVAVGGTMKLRKSCENELYQLECLLSLSDI
jgi:hypothetical protein